MRKVSWPINSRTCNHLSLRAKNEDVHNYNFNPRRASIFRYRKHSATGRLQFGIGDAARRLKSQSIIDPNINPVSQLNGNRSVLVDIVLKRFLHHFVPMAITINHLQRMFGLTKPEI